MALAVEVQEAGLLWVPAGMPVMMGGVWWLRLVAETLSLVEAGREGIDVCFAEGEVVSLMGKERQGGQGGWE